MDTPGKEFHSYKQADAPYTFIFMNNTASSITLIILAHLSTTTTTGTIVCGAMILGNTDASQTHKCEVHTRMTHFKFFVNLVSRVL